MPTILVKLVATGAAAAAAVVAQRGVEFGWRAVRGQEPPRADGGPANDTELRDMMLWSALLAVSVLIARKIATDATESLLAKGDDQDD